MPGDTEAKLRAAILQRPDDDGPRLAYADWLDAGPMGVADAVEWSQFIRVQIERARVEQEATPAANWYGNTRRLPTAEQAPEMRASVFATGESPPDVRWRPADPGAGLAVFHRYREFALVGIGRRAYDWSGFGESIWRIGHPSWWRERVHEHRPVADRLLPNWWRDTADMQMGGLFEFCRGFVGAVGHNLDSLRRLLPWLLRRHPIQSVWPYNLTPGVHEHGGLIGYRYWRRDQLPREIWELIENDRKGVAAAVVSYLTERHCYQALSDALILEAKRAHVGRGDSE